MNISRPVAATAAPKTAVPMLVLVEGDSDAAAVGALAELLECDLESHRIQVVPASGVTNFSRLLTAFVHEHPAAKFCGMYVVAGERHVRRALAQAGHPVAANEPVQSAGFFACVADLEEELIRALGAEAVEHVIEAEGELSSFRRFQAMPEHRGTPVDHQLHRFLGTRATRKVRCARRLVEALGVARLPPPLAQIRDRLLEVVSRGGT